MQNTVVVALLVALAVNMASAKPGYLFTVPAASSDVSVVRDALGNQATSYAYQDGHSSAVAVSRSDVSKHLVYQPAPVVYQPAVVPTYVAAHAPLVYQHGAYYL